MKSYVLFTYDKQENTTFSPHFQETWGPPSSAFLYNARNTSFEALIIDAMNVSFARKYCCLAIPTVRLGVARHEKAGQ